MLVPLPAVVLDLLLAMSFAASVLVLLSALQILRPAQFSVFPSLLLLLTLFRLSLNLASSRRILLHGNEGAGAAGRVIEAFGQFVVGGNYIVGFVLFLALIAIQYIVVSHGAVRTAEVTARFTLDALPGKQMAIDADLNAGLIDESQARARREQMAREAEFYGAMDGAARFNQRDSIATILITAINILAGFLIGVFQLDIPFREALKTYTVLTVGDGLVTHDSIAAGFDGGRHGGDARVVERHALGRPRNATAVAAPLATDSGGRDGGARLHSRDCRNFPSSPLPESCCCSHRGCPLRSKIKTAKVIEPSLADPERPLRRAAKKTKRRRQIRIASKTCSSWTNFRSRWATRSSLWSTSRKGDNCSRASRRCAAVWRCNWASSFRPFISPTTCGSSRANT